MGMAGVEEQQEEKEPRSSGRRRKKGKGKKREKNKKKGLAQEHEEGKIGEDPMNKSPIPCHALLLEDSYRSGRETSYSPPTDQETEIEKKKPLRKEEEELSQSSAVDDVSETEKEKFRKQVLEEQELLGKQGGGFPDILFILHSTDCLHSFVYALDTTGIGPTTTATATTPWGCREGDDDHFPIKLLFKFPYKLGRNFVSSKSTLYAVGGDYDEEAAQFPTETLICDLADWRNRGEQHQLQWEAGPALNGPKPSPVLAAIDGNLYALAGPNVYAPEIPPESAFEVFEPCLGWKLLPPPPFSAYYLKQLGPPILFDTVIDRTIYVGLGDESSKECLYSYNVDTQVWTQYASPGRGTIPGNLFNCHWCPSSEVANNMMFQCTRGYGGHVQVYAWDLAAQGVEEPPAEREEEVVVLEAEEEEVVVGEEEEDPGESYDCAGGEDSSFSADDGVASIDTSDLSPDEPASSEDGANRLSSDTDDYPIVNNRYLRLSFPVHGLKAVAGLVKGGMSTAGFVAHLAENVYCMVYFYPSPHLMTFRIRVCTFQVVEQQHQPRCFLRVKILRSARHALGLGLYFEDQRYKIYM